MMLCWVIVYKFFVELVWICLEVIDIQVGCIGVLSFVVCLQFVIVGGVVVFNVILYNEDYIIGLDSKGQEICGGKDI